jgi:hypothetical protein
MTRRQITRDMERFNGARGGRDKSGALDTSVNESAGARVVNQERDMDIASPV